MKDNLVLNKVKGSSVFSRKIQQIIDQNEEITKESAKLLEKHRLGQPSLVFPQKRKMKDDSDTESSKDQDDEIIKVDWKYKNVKNMFETVYIY